MSTDLNRRDLLALLGAGAAATGLLGCKDGTAGDTDSDAAMARSTPPDTDWPGAIAAQTTAFPLGAAFGDPTPADIVLASRYTGSGALSLVLAAWDGSAWTERTIPLTPGADGFVKAAIDGLAADTWYAWQLRDDAGGATEAGRFVTPPDPEHTGTIRLGFSSCTDQDHDAFPALTNALAVGPTDLFVLLGDTCYFDGLRTQAQYRALWERNLMAPGFTDIRRGSALAVTWDDHEVTNNWDPQSIPQSLLQTATDAMFEANPIRETAADPRRVWRSLRYGKAVELFILDCRGERDRSAGLYLSRAQMDWLKAGLAASDATWKVIANSVPIAESGNVAWDLPDLLADRWGGFPEARRELLDFITGEGLTGVIFVSGDVHCAWVARVDKEGDARNLFDVVVGPGGSFLNPTVFGLVDGDAIPWGEAVWNAASLAFHVDGTCEVTYTGEGVIRGEPAEIVRARFVLTDTGGLTLSDVADPATTQPVGG